MRVKHIVMWKWKEEIKEEDKEGLKLQMQENLTGLVGIVPGLLDAKVIISPIASSTHDIALVTEMESKEALEGYSVHEAHVKVANTYVRPFVCERACLDYFI